VNFIQWIRELARPDAEMGWSEVRFVTRAKTLFYARLAFLAVGLLILAVPRWAQAFGAQSPWAFVVYFVMIAYSVICYLLIERGPIGKGVTFGTLCMDVMVLVYMIAFSGGLKSPVLPTQVVYTIFFALLFPSPLAILPPLLTLPVVAKIDTEIPGRTLELEDLFILIWYSAVNFIVVYVIVYLNEREEWQHNEIVNLQENLRHMAVVEERNRLSREIHDGLGASLSSLIIQAEYLNNLAKDEEMKAEIGELKEVAEESIDELRRSISMMREDFDLVTAFDEYCINFAQRVGLEVGMRVTGSIPKLNSELQLTAFRILQETLSNIRKHAKAKRVDVELICMDGQIKLEVADDGEGFDYQGHLKGHFGLANMRERAKQYSGSLEVDSSPGKGCRIIFQVPLDRGKKPEQGVQTLMIEQRQGAINDGDSGIGG